jgi:type I restriction enzyme M protein
MNATFGTDFVLRRIAEDGYNLNISRYISTAPAEEEIDLAATHKSLVESEKGFSAARDEHTRFLKELGQAPLPGK